MALAADEDEAPPPPPPPPPPAPPAHVPAASKGRPRDDERQTEEQAGRLPAGAEGVQVSGAASKKRVAAAPGEPEEAAEAGGPARRTAPRASSRESSQRAAARKRGRANEGGGPAPNASLFVGYVEDGETIEMIMKKFERLEEIKREAAAAAAASATAAASASASSSSFSPSAAASTSAQDGLDDATLAKVFQETSAFTVQSATREAREPGYFYDEDDFDEMMDEAEDDGWDWGDMRATQGKDGETLFLVGDGTDDDLWEEVFGGGRKKKKAGRAAAGGKGGSRVPGSRHETGVTQVAFVSDLHGRFVTGLKKVRKVDPNAIVYQKIPSEVTRSWAKAIQPYRPRGALEGTHTQWRPDAITRAEEQFPVSGTRPQSCEQIAVASVLDRAAWAAAAPVAARAPGEAHVLSPPWREARLGHLEGEAGEAGEAGVQDNPNNDPQGIEPEDLLKLGLGSQALLAAGFVFVWTPKHLILRVLRVLEQMDLHYVENAVVVKQRCNNELWREPSRYLRQSKETLLICRRGKKHAVNGKIAWARVEIRHQRTSDVHFEFCRPDREARVAGAHLVPHAYVHNMVETMLPLGRFNPLERSKKQVKADSLEAEAHAEGEAEGEAEADELTTPTPRDPAQHPGKLLHLWAPRGALRTGWVSVCQSG